MALLRVCPVNGYVRKDIASLDELWVEIDATWDGTLIDNNYGYLVDFVNGPGGGATEMFGVWWNGLFHYWEDDLDSGDTNATPVPAALGTFQTFKFHFHRNVATAFYVNGSLRWTGGEVYDLPVDRKSVV